MASRQNADPEEEGWERTDFPVVCEDCLGPNPYIRMQKTDYAAECAISGRPFTVFRWRPGTEARYKKTVVCKEIALAKNVCQVCLLDLDYGIPVQARDAALAAAGAYNPNSDALLGAKSDVNIEFQTERIAQRIANGEDVTEDASLAVAGAGGKQRAHEILSKMARKTPYYNKNKTAICSFWLRNACTRADCPYRPCNGDTNMPELQSSAEMRTQNLKDRYYGVNDPVANKMMARTEERDAAAKKSMEPPSDTNITTLYVGGLDERVTEDSLRDVFYQYGTLKSVKVLSAKKCAFVTFADRAGAEAAAKQAGHEVHVEGLRLRVMWGKPAGSKGDTKGKGGAGVGGAGGAPGSNAPGADVPGSNPTNPDAMQMPFAPPNGKGAYPSMDPKALGSYATGDGETKAK